MGNNVILRLVYFIKNYKLQVIFLFIGILLSSAGTVGSVATLKPILNEIFVAKDESKLYTIPFLLVGVYIIKGLGRFIQAYFTNYIGQDIVKNLRNLCLDKILHLDMPSLNTFSSGELISRITNDVNRVQQVVANMVPEAIKESITILGLISYAIYESPKLTFYALIVLPITLFPLNKLARRMKKISEQSLEKISDLTHRLTEIFYNTEIIRANSTENLETKKFAKENQTFFKISMKAVKISELVSPLMEIFGALGITAVIIIGGKEVIEDKMSIGSFFSFLTAIGMIFDPVRRLSGLHNKIQEAIAAAQRIFFILDKKNTILDGKEELNEDIKQITIKNVSLKYTNQIALSKINLEAKKGDFIGLIGDSGGGKSSLIKLIMRFYDPNEGELYINNKDIKNFKLKSLRNKIALVSQRVYIFKDSLAANVAYGMDIDEKRVLKALNIADASNFVNNLENGIYTELEEFGSNLSGGQKQRIALARAIYKNADILILDEATSALDNKSENKIKESLKEVIKEKITFCIAHRLSTIKDANNIYIIKKGMIVDKGSYAHLIKNSKEYKKLSGQEVEYENNI